MISQIGNDSTDYWKMALIFVLNVRNSQRCFYILDVQ